MEKEWVVNFRRQCEASHVPFFFKQWGGVRKAEAGRRLEGKTYDEMPCRQPGRVAPQQRIRLNLIDEVNAWDRELLSA
jgi:hypothetical protein